MSYDAVNPDPTVITVWSDIGCPWGTLALTTLRRAIDDAGEPLRIDHRVFPLELFNRIPTPKSILDAEVVTIAAVLPELGWRLWSGAESTYPVSMILPMAAVQAAKAPLVGGLLASDELDAALRHAFYADSRCISIPSEILDIGRACAAVDADALQQELSQGGGIAQLYRDFAVARAGAVRGSPHLFTADGWQEHNPGASYGWTAPPPSGFPRLHGYSPNWASSLVERLKQPRNDPAGRSASTGSDVARLAVSLPE
jgi:predicted DsbA family dithiol-disulfide isomerase